MSLQFRGTGQAVPWSQQMQKEPLGLWGPEAPGPPEGSGTVLRFIRKEALLLLTVALCGAAKLLITGRVIRIHYRSKGSAFRESAPPGMSPWCACRNPGWDTLALGDITVTEDRV